MQNDFFFLNTKTQTRMNRLEKDRYTLFSSFQLSKKASIREFVIIDILLIIFDISIFFIKFIIKLSM